WGGPETVIVVSSDLSHYHPHAEAQRLDRATIGRILALDGPLDHDQACGATPVNGLLVAARDHGLEPTLLGACNSGDTAGDKRRVVGYAAVAFREGGTL
ncbi:MAG: AmmeMemoRadiSam system protein B, partial [Propionibacteriaceae bacterium]|nr:AmmeMemoRadiSam system protein B [Propionibacteriaceae bacterium]